MKQMIIFIFTLSLVAFLPAQEKLASLNEKALAAIQWLEQQNNAKELTIESIVKNYEQLILQNLPGELGHQGFKSTNISVSTTASGIQVDIYAILVNLWRKNALGFTSRNKSREFRYSIPNHLDGIHYLSRKCSFWLTNQFRKNREEQKLPKFSLKQICDITDEAISQEIKTYRINFFEDFTLMKQAKFFKEHPKFTLRLERFINEEITDLKDAFEESFLYPRFIYMPDADYYWPKEMVMLHSIENIKVDIERIIDTAIDLYLIKHQPSTKEKQGYAKHIKIFSLFLDEHPKIKLFLKNLIKNGVTTCVLDELGFISLEELDGIQLEKTPEEAINALLKKNAGESLDD